MKYFAIIDGRQQGPFTLDQLPQAGVGPDTYVWCKTMENWQQAHTVADICRFYRQHLAAIMSPGGANLSYDDRKEKPADNAAADSDTDFPLRWRAIVEKAGEHPVRLPEPETDLTRQPHFWLWEAVAATLLCCLPIGLAATWFAIKSRRLWRNKRAAQAHEAARTAKILVLLSLCFGLIIYAVALRSSCIL